MEARRRKPGSVRLTDSQYEEMERLGFTSESAYVKYKMGQGQSKLQVVKASPVPGEQLSMLPATQTSAVKNPAVEDQLVIQRLSIENQQLQEQLEQLSQKSQETLNGVNGQVHHLLQEELRKRDFESLKKEHSLQEKKISELEEALKTSKKETEAKQEEIEALVKKLGFVEVGKALLPGAISGLARQYPTQMKGIAGTLGSLGLANPSEDTAAQEEDHLLQIIKYLKELFTEEQFEQVVQLIMQLGEQLKDDQSLLQKLGYYLNQLQKNNNKES